MIGGAYEKRRSDKDFLLVGVSGTRGRSLSLIPSTSSTAPTPPVPPEPRFHKPFATQKQTGEAGEESVSKKPLKQQKQSRFPLLRKRSSTLIHREEEDVSKKSSARGSARVMKDSSSSDLTLSDLTRKKIATFEITQKMAEMEASEGKRGRGRVRDRDDAIVNPTRSGKHKKFGKSEEGRPELDGAEKDEGDIDGEDGNEDEDEDEDDRSFADSESFFEEMKERDHEVAEMERYEKQKRVLLLEDKKRIELEMLEEQKDELRGMENSEFAAKVQKVLSEAAESRVQDDQGRFISRYSQRMADNGTFLYTDSTSNPADDALMQKMYVYPTTK
jgi:hypothetical protein